MAPKIADTLLFFAPEQWGEVQKFSNLCSGTYEFDERTKRALAGVGQHYDKALIFRRLADALAPGLRVDREHLDTHGFTPTERSSEVAAVFEAAIVELYSCVDCAAKVLRSIYETRTRGFKKSTRSLFLELDNITGDFPEPLRDAIRGGARMVPPPAVPSRRADPSGRGAVRPPAWRRQAPLHARRRQGSRQGP
jgi:hypothetical protein